MPAIPLNTALDDSVPLQLLLPVPDICFAHQATGVLSSWRSASFQELDLLLAIAINAGPGLFIALMWTRTVVHLLPTKRSNTGWFQDSLLPSCGHGWWYTCHPPTVPTNVGPGLYCLVWLQMVTHQPPTKCSKCWPRTLYCLPMDTGGSTHLPHTNCSSKC